MKPGALFLLALMTFVGLMLGNLLWAACVSHDWRAAAERSFFQGWALGGFVLLLWARGAVRA